MIKGHKFFHSTSFPDKTNDLIFLKSKKKKQLLFIFANFLVIFVKWIFPKEIGLCCAHLHMVP